MWKKLLLNLHCRNRPSFDFSPMDVYVMKDGKRQGPYQLFRLTEMLADGDLTLEDRVWHEGMDGWKPLGEAESLRSVQRTPVTPEPAETEQEEPSPPVRVQPPPLPEMLTLELLRQRRALAWRRFFARQLDMTLLLIVVVAAAAQFGWTDLWALHSADSWPLLFAPGLLGIVVETLMLPLLGWTPGRLILGLRVATESGDRPTYAAALRRSLLVWAGGLGFGLPANALLPMAQWMYSFWHYQQRGETLWDRSAKTRVLFRPLTARHAAGIALTTAGIAAMNAWVWFKEPLPSRISGEERTLIEQLRTAAWDGVLAPSPEKK